MNLTKKIIQGLTVVVFLGMIALPALKMLTTPDQKISEFEKRNLAQVPRYNGHGLSRNFVEQVETYLNDQFGYREDLIYGRAYLDAFYLHKAPSDKVLIGQDGWLYYTYPYQVADRQGLVNYSDADKGFWRYVFQRRQDWLAERGVTYVLVIAPDKKTIYPEYYPSQYPVIYPDNTMLDQFLETLQNTSTVNMLDLREPLLNYKNYSGDTRLLYHKTDTHWTPLGSYIAYQYIIDNLRQYEPDIPRLEGGHLIYDPTSEWIFDEDLAIMTNLREEFTQPFPALTVAPSYQCATEVPYTGILWPDKATQTYCPDNDVNIIVFHDSFFKVARPYLRESFGTVTFFYRLRFEPWFWEAEMEALIAETGTTIVVEEIVERSLPRLPETLDEHTINKTQ